MGQLDKTEKLGFVMRRDDKTVYIFGDNNYMAQTKEYLWYVRPKRKKVERRNNKTKGD